MSVHRSHYRDRDGTDRRPNRNRVGTGRRGGRRSLLATVAVFVLTLSLFGAVFLIGVTGSASAAAEPASTASESAGSVADYTDDEGVVDTDGLREAIDHWHAGEADTDLLREVIDAWRSGSPVVTVENVDQSTAHATLQDAIDEAEVGNTLELRATTFEEDVAVDVEGLTLRGSDAGTSTIDPAEIGITVEADEVTLEGLTIAVDDETADEARGVVVLSGSNDVSIVDNTFVLDGSWVTDVRGISLEGFGATVEGNTFDGSTNTNAMRLYSASEATIAANEFIGGSTGVWTSGEDVRVEDNTFTDVADWSIRTGSHRQEIVNNSMSGGNEGIWLDSGGEVAITENEFETTRYGIRHVAQSVDAAITNNVFTGADVGYYVPDVATDRHVDGVEMHWNTIAGNGEGINVTHGEGTLDATDNWWGDESGPSGEGPGDGDSVTENVAYDPWLADQPGQTITGTVGTTDFDQGQENVTQTLGAVDGGETIEIDFGPHDVSSAVVRVDLSELPATLNEDYRFILDEASVDIDDDDVTNAEVHTTGVGGSDEAAILLDVEDRFVTIEEFSLTGLNTSSVVTNDEFSYDVTLTNVTLADDTDVTNVRETTETQSFEIVPPEQTLSVDGVFDVSDLTAGDESATQHFGSAHDLTIDLNRDDVRSVQVNVDLTPLVDQGVDLTEADVANVESTKSINSLATGVRPDHEQARVRFADLDGDRTIELSSFEMVDVDLTDAEPADGLAYEIELDQLSIDLPGGGAQHQFAAYNFEGISTDEFDIESSSG